MRARFASLRRLDAWTLALLACFGAMLLVVLASAWVEFPADAQARAHPEYDGLLRSGSVAASHQLWVHAWLFGSQLVTSFSVLLIRPALRRGVGSGAWGILITWLCLQVAFAGLALSYRDYSSAPVDTALWGPFPPPTTWMLLVFYPSQLLFVVHFALGFRRWFWTDDDQQRYDELVRDARGGRS